jgi:hypothetical protein
MGTWTRVWSLWLRLWDDPAGAKPPYARVWQFDLEPISTSPEDVELCSLIRILDDARGTGWAAVNVCTICVNYSLI